MRPDTDTPEEVSTDLVFEILSNKRRRMVLYYLQHNDGSATIQELAKRIAALENDVSVEELSDQQRKRVYVSLYQTHIPKLQESDIIHYDEERGEVHLTDRARAIDSYLTPATDSEYPWQLHYLVLALIGGVLLVASFAGVPGIAAVSSLWLGLGLVFAFGVSAIVQYWYQNQQQREAPIDY